MTSKGRGSSLLLLLGAAIVTSAIVTELRYAWVGGWAPSAVEQNHIGPLLGSFIVFALGGAAAALMCWFLEGRALAGESSVIRRRVLRVLVPNALAALIGLFPLYLLTWDWAQAISLVVGLAVIGSLMFLIAVACGSVFRGRDAEEIDAMTSRR